MLDHHLQRQILYTLVTNPEVRFSKLKPSGIDSNVFTYHLQQLIKQGLVTKTEDGSYKLTALGKSAGINSTETAESILRQAHSVLFMAASNKSGDYLLRRRLAHPVYGKLGFVHGEPIFEEAIEVTANRIFEEKTGIKANFKPAGAGYIRIFREDEMESFTHFTLLVDADVEGNPIQTSRTGENLWVKSPDFTSDDMIPSMNSLVYGIQSGEFFFQELTFHL